MAFYLLGVVLQSWGGEGGGLLGVPVGSSFQRCGGTDGLCPKLRAQCACASPSKVYPAGKLQ